MHGSRIVIGAALSGDGADAIREATAGKRAAVVSDTNVAPLHADKLATRLGVDAGDRFNVRAGEASKTRGEWGRLTDALLARGFARDSAIVAVGGGVVGDLAGFVAATFMRGVPVVQVPTTLLAMIDAAIGGKTGVDTNAGKNLVGAFHHPVLVVADPATLRTLPAQQLRNGLAEAAKHAFITSPAELGWLLENVSLLRDGDALALAQLVERNVRIKAGVVARDEKEGGLRKTLNFGHTIGHALESVSAFEMLHGECVAIGMLVEARIAVAAQLAPPTLVDSIHSSLVALGLPVRVPSQMASDTVLLATRSDKKSRSGRVEYALLSDVGQPASASSGYGTSVPDEIVLGAIDATR